MARYSKEQLDRMQQELSTAVLCDILDELGYRHQAMKGRIYPLEDDYKVVGTAKTMLVYDVYEMPVEAYKTEIEAVDSIKEGDLVVCANSSCSNGFWGELMTTAAIARGARGVIVDGAIRDIAQIKAMGERFKTFTAGRNPLDSKGRCLVADYDCTIMCDGVAIKADDLVFADIDGIVVIPGEVADQVFLLAMKKVQGENILREELKKGAYLKDVFAKYQIL